MRKLSPKALRQCQSLANKFDKTVEWAIIIEKSSFGKDRPYWAFSIFGPDSDEKLFVGSADDLPTCLDMAQEGMGTVQAQFEALLPAPPSKG